MRKTGLMYLINEICVLELTRDVDSTTFNRSPREKIFSSRFARRKPMNTINIIEIDEKAQVNSCVTGFHRIDGLH